MPFAVIAITFSSCPVENGLFHSFFAVNFYVFEDIITHIKAI